jgi:hypothetical protein
MRARSHGLMVLGVVLTVGVAAPAFAAAPVTLQWRVNGGVTAPAPLGSLYAAAGSTVTATKVSYGVAVRMDFAGWRGTAVGAALSPTASMLSTDKNFATDPDGGSDGGSSAFDPMSGPFTASVWVKPTRASAFPRGSTPPSAISPNIVQKGRMGAAGGYWKLSMEMVRTSDGLRWAPMCTFRAASGEILSVNRSGEAGLVMSSPGTGYTLTCSLAAGRATVTMTPDGGATSSASLTATGPFTVANSQAVSVGHKPLTDSATDIYDGLLANLTITAP